MTFRDVRVLGGWTLMALVVGCDADDKVLTFNEQPLTGGAAATTTGSGSGETGGSGTDTASSGNLGTGSPTGGETNPTSGVSPTDGGLNGASGAGGSSAAEPHVAADPDCDMNGIWIGRQTTASTALEQLQYANNWYYLEFTQDGEEVVISNHFDCGIEVQGSVLVQIRPETRRALSQHNLQVGRRGTMAKQPDGTCQFQMERFWSVRGANEAALAPSPRNSPMSIMDVAAANPLPQAPELAEDWDGDGQPGIAWVITSLNVVRHTAQRDWTRWFTAPGYEIQASTEWTDDLVVRSEFDNEEVIYGAVAGDGQGILDQLIAGTAKQGSTPANDQAHTLTLRLLARGPQAPRLAESDIVADTADQTCLNIQDALPAVRTLERVR